MGTKQRDLILVQGREVEEKYYNHSNVTINAVVKKN